MLTNTQAKSFTFVSGGFITAAALYGLRAGGPVGALAGGAVATCVVLLCALMMWREKANDGK